MLIVTIQKAISGICALSAAGIYLPAIEVEDVTISASDGQVKVGTYRTLLRDFSTAERQ
jgi:hypothetical protein